MRNLLLWLMSISLALQLAGCSGPQQGPSKATLRIGVLPDESAEALRRRFNPLLEFLAQETRLTCELVIPHSYPALVQKFAAGQVDLAYLGGATFVQSSAKAGAVPLVMRDVDTRFTSVLVVADENIKTFKDLQGKRLSFGAKLSTSGHLMPRHFLQAAHGVTPEEYFRSIQYSGQHDRTAYWVRDGEVDAGIINSEIIHRMFTDGRLRPGDVRIIWTTPPYSDYVWAVQPQIDPMDRERIRQAFLQLAVDKPQHQVILSNLGAASYYPASIKDFTALQQIMDSQGML